MLALRIRFNFGIVDALKVIGGVLIFAIGIGFLGYGIGCLVFTIINIYLYFFVTPEQPTLVFIGLLFVAGFVSTSIGYWLVKNGYAKMKDPE